MNANQNKSKLRTQAQVLILISRQAGHRGNDDNAIVPQASVVHFQNSLQDLSEVGWPG